MLLMSSDIWTKVDPVLGHCVPTSSCSCRYKTAIPGALQDGHILNHIFPENPARFSQCLAILPKAFCSWQVKLFAVLLSLSHSHAGNIAITGLLSPVLG